MQDQLAAGRRVLIACGAGISRSVTFAIAVLHEEGSGNAVVLPYYVLETLGVSQGEAIYFHRDGGRFQVLTDFY